MDFAFTEEQQALGDIAARLFGDKATTERVAEIERRTVDRVDHDLWRELAHAQLLGVAIPEQFGGLGFGVLELLVVLEQQGRFVAPVPLLPTLVLGAGPIAEFGSVEQKQRWLPAMVDGRRFLTGAFAQPGANETVSIRATPQADGWVLNGTSIVVPAAHIADVVVVPARTENGVTVFAISPAAPGVSATRIETTARDVESHLHFDEVAVTTDDVIGAVDDGVRIVEWVVDRAQLAGAALVLGCCSQALAITAGYVSQRTQFGKPLSTNQGVAIRAADGYIDIDCLRVTMWQAAWRLAAGLPAREQIATAKYWAAAGGHRVVHATQHLHGGMGADIDYPVHRYFLWVKQLENNFGGAPQQLARLGSLIAASAKAQAVTDQT